MNRCPITYEECGDDKYSKRGLHLLSPKLDYLNDLPYTKDEQLEEVISRAGKMSIQGVQPKLSARLNVRQRSFELVDMMGRYILKPQHPSYKNLPENEDLTMKLAAQAGMEVPLHGMIYAKDNSLVYFIKRFDRITNAKKLAVEDFAQLSGKDRDTKYDSSMEQVIKIVEEFCTFPELEKIKLFKRTIFSYLVGNEDMHLKNFSVITKNGIVSLSPCYDFLNSAMAVKSDEEMALPINGKKRNLTPDILFDYLGKQRLGLNDISISKVLSDLGNAIDNWIKTIDISFLPQEQKDQYKTLILSGAEKINLI